MGSTEDLNRAGLLAIGLIPEWVDQGVFTGAPNTTSRGVFLTGFGESKGTAGAQGQVNARAEVHRRTGRIKIDTFDLLVGVYSITIEAALLTYDTSVELPADNAALVQGLVDEINGGPAAITDALTASVDPEDADAVLLLGDVEAGWSLDATLAGGTGAITVTADATGFDVRLFTTPGGILRSGTNPETLEPNAGNPDGWALAANAEWPGNSYRGWHERFDIAGRDRAYLEVYNVTKDAADGATLTPTIHKVMIGPHVIEATAATA